MTFEAGLAGSADMTVTVDDTSIAYGSGNVPVLSTPRLIALVEQATVAAVAGQSLPGQTTVGMRVQLDHLMPTAVGSPVTADAVLEKVNGRRLTFTVSASDPRGLIAAGRVTRVIVDEERFLDKTR